MAEDFKLATGTWVSVGPLRARFVAHCAPYVSDVVVAGHDRDEAAALVVPEPCGLPRAGRHVSRRGERRRGSGERDVRAKFASLLAAFNKAAGGSSGRFARIILLDDPPSLDTGELTDKGSINQRAALKLRAAAVDELYAASPSRRVIAERLKEEAAP